MSLRPRFRLALPVLSALALAGSAPPAHPIVNPVFSTGFDQGLPAEFSAPGSVIEGVQGYAGLGPAGNQFGGSFLRYTLQGIADTRLTLRNLPPHDAVSVGFLLAVIDSWDGTELLRISVDGTELFSHWFQLALGDTSSYLAPPGALLSSGGNLGFTFGTYYSRDRAYDLSAEPAFRQIPHDADTLEVKWSLGAVSGGAASQWQGGGDESWAIDQVRIDLHEAAVGVDSRPTLFLAPPSPNPLRGSEFLARFTLAGPEPARLELVDVRGRRLAARDLGGLDAGAHAVRLVPSATAGPGIAFLRLTQGAATRVVRVVRLD
jgi:hypothetical protein